LLNICKKKNKHYLWQELYIFQEAENHIIGHIME